MAYCWLTDPHLNFLDHNKRQKWYKQLKEYEGIIISGDIGEANSVFGILKEMYLATRLPIYYVLGNHDYYRGEVNEVRNYAEAFTEDPDLEGQVIYLTRSPCFIELRPRVFLVGVDGWACGTAGDIMGSDIRLNDANYIADLRWAEYNGGRKGMAEKMHDLSYHDMNILDRDLDHHITEQEIDEIIIVTHVPPFEEACRYQGKATGKDFLPFFCNKVLGTLIDTYANWHPNIKFTVLCGHTHDQCHYNKRDNLKVMVGGAKYYLPEIQLAILDKEDYDE